MFKLLQLWKFDKSLVFKNVNFFLFKCVKPPEICFLSLLPHRSTCLFYYIVSSEWWIWVINKLILISSSLLFIAPFLYGYHQRISIKLLLFSSWLDAMTLSVLILGRWNLMHIIKIPIKISSLKWWEGKREKR